MQKIDVTLEGKPWLVDQRSDNKDLWNRIRNAAQTAQHIGIDRHAVPVPPPPPPTPTGFTITSSVKGGALTAPVKWAITAAVPLAKVEFFIDGVLKTTESQSPYEYGGDGGMLDPAALGAGNHVLRAVATATDGRTAEVTFTVTVAVAPTPPPPPPPVPVPGPDGRLDLSSKASDLKGMLSWLAAHQQPAVIPNSEYHPTGLIDIPAGSDVLFTGAGLVVAQDLHIMAFRPLSDTRVVFEKGWRYGKAGTKPLAKRTFTNAEAVGFMFGSEAPNMVDRPHNIYVDFGDMIIEAPGNNAFFMYRHSYNITLVGNCEGVNTPADCFHLTGGVHDIDMSKTVLRATGAGDDDFANVSYKGDSALVTNVKWGVCIGRNQKDGGRGFSVVGGKNISAVSVDVDGTTGAAIYIAAEANYNTYGVDGVKLPAVKARNPNTMRIHNANVVIYNAQSDQVIQNVDITIDPDPAWNLVARSGTYPILNTFVNGASVKQVTGVALLARQAKRIVIPVRVLPPKYADYARWL